MSAGWKKNCVPGNSVGQARAQLVDVITRGHRAFRLEADEDFGIGFADHAGIAVGGVDGAVEQADVVEHVAEIFRRNDAADQVVDIVAFAGGFLDALAGASAHVQADQAGVHAGEEIAAQHQRNRRGEPGKTAESSTTKVQACSRQKPRALR